jgi:uncharacterized protein YbjT (DUF2867 family)
MRIFSWLFKAIAVLAAAGVVAIVAYVFLMSGIFHTPRSFFQPAAYQPPRDTILIVGGTKGTGLEIVKQLVARKQPVVVTVRASSNTEALEALGVETVVMDALDPEQVRAAVSQRPYAAIVSTLGTSSRDLPSRQNTLQGLIKGQTRMDPNKRPDFIGNRHVIDAAVEAGIRRFIFITVIGAGDSAQGLPWLARRGHDEVIPLKTQAEDHLRRSGLDYTIIRPGGLGPRNLAATGTAKLTEDPEAFSYMGRTDLAFLTLDSLGDSRTIGKTYTAYDPSRRYLWRLFID